jgi:hypothetical protein
MGYELRAIFVRSADVDRGSGRESNRFVELPQGMLMLPILEKDWDDRALSDENRHSANQLQHFPDWLKSWMRSISEGGLVAYAEISCHGGPCCRDILCMKDGDILWERSEEDQGVGYRLVRKSNLRLITQKLLPFLDQSKCYTMKGPPTALDDLFAEFGIECKGYWDAFEALGLDQHRDTEDWVDQ